MAKKQARQLEMPNAPARDAVGKKAIAYIEARDAYDAAKAAMLDAGTELTAAMCEKKRKEIRVEGVLITRQRTEAQDKLKVKKPRE